jgi:hypothetical protein
MDNNFYKILETFKRIEEGSTKDWLWRQAERLDKDTFISNAGEYGMTPEEAAEWWDSINGDIEEGTKFNFAGEKRGQRPGDQWRGTDQGTPGTKLVGGCEESIEVGLEEELMNEWNQYLKEIGAPGVYSATSSSAATTNTSTGSTPAATNPADVAKKKADIQKNLQGIPGIDANKAVANLTDKDDSGLDAALTKALTDPSTSQQAKQLLAKGMK